MATRSHECSKRGNKTVCPSCGRIAPDWCAEDEPADLVVHVVQPTGSDLDESKAAVADAEAHKAQLEADRAEAETKVFQGRRGRKAQ